MYFLLLIYRDVKYRFFQKKKGDFVLLKLCWVGYLEVHCYERVVVFQDTFFFPKGNDGATVLERT